MPRTKAIEGLEINYKGEFFMEMLYKVMYYWLIDHNFMEASNGDDRIETFYFDNNWPGGQLKEVWYWWRTKKIESPFFTYYINIDAHILGMAKGEKIVDGKKVRTNNLEVSLFFDAVLEYGEGKMDISKNPLTNAFSKTFYGRVHKQQVEDKKNALYAQVHELINVTKQHLGLLQHQPQQKPFHDPMGVPQFN